MSHIARESEDIRLIPIDRIEILNPRERNQKTFREIVASIKALGLKKPITVTRRGTGERERFMLVWSCPGFVPLL
jgi:ParB family chromosome partitioning protein